MKMKSFIKPMLALVFLAIIVVSCSKDADPPIDLSATNWEDSAVINSIVYKPFKIAFNANGTAQVTIGSFAPFQGSWNKSVSSNQVYFFFDENNTTKWKGEGALIPDKNTITGTLTRTTPSVFNGTFHVMKK